MLQDFDVLVMHSCDHDLCNEGVSKQRSGGLKFELSFFFLSKTKIIRHYKMREFDKGKLKGCKEWMFPKIVVPQNGWFIMENPIKNG